MIRVLTSRMDRGLIESAAECEMDLGKQELP